MIKIILRKLLILVILIVPALRFASADDTSSLVRIRDQSDLRGPFCYQDFWTWLGRELEAFHVVISSDNFDLTYFGRVVSDESFTRHFDTALQLAQMQRTDVSASGLIQGILIHFQGSTFLEKYSWQSLTVVMALLSAGLIAFLLHERQLRRDAEVESRSRMSELAHVNRNATAGELLSMIVHGLDQPLGSILVNAEAAEMILKSEKPDLGEVSEILASIKRDNQYAGDMIRRLRAFMKKTSFVSREVDLNEIMAEAFKFLSVQASARNVSLHLQTAPNALRIKGDPVLMQQVVVNLVVNSMDALTAISCGRTVIGRTESTGGSTVEISISDTGPGIPPGKLAQVFDPFYTTKELGMGIGLSIARSIVLAHNGQIWAKNQRSGGASFYIVLPLID